MAVRHYLICFVRKGDTKNQAMKNPKFEKTVLFLFLGLFIAAGVVFTLLLGKTYREYLHIKSREIDYAENVSKKEAQLKEKEEKLYRLRHDPEYIERVIRQRPGYAKPGGLELRCEELEAETGDSR